MKDASAYQCKSLILFQATSQTTDGLGLLSGPCIVVSMDDADRALGRALRLALRGSKVNIPHPVQWSNRPYPMLKAANVTSWAAFSRLAACVEIELEGDTLRITPTVNRGPRQGYQYLKEQQLTAAAPADSRIGAMLREAFARTEKEAA